MKHRHIIYLLYVYEVSSVVIQRASYTQNYVRTNQPNYDNPRTLAPTNKTCRLSYLLQILQVCTGKVQLLWELARFQVTPREVVPTSENRSLANIFFDTLTVYSCLVSIALVFNMEYYANCSTLAVSLQLPKDFVSYCEQNPKTIQQGRGLKKSPLIQSTVLC